MPTGALRQAADTRAANVLALANFEVEIEELVRNPNPQP